MTASARFNSSTVMDRMDLEVLNADLAELKTQVNPDHRKFATVEYNPKAMRGLNHLLFYRVPAYNGNNPFRLKSFDRFMQDPQKDSVLKNELAFLTCDLHVIPGMPLLAGKKKFAVS